MIEDFIEMIRTRFAPSPTGYMHIGNLRTAIFEYLIAKSQGGKFILRIEDTDQERFVEGATEMVYKTMKTAGLDHDEGPDVGGDFGPYVQSERKSLYAPYAHELVEKGGAHYCFCSKNAVEDDKEDVVGAKFKDPCRHIPLEEAKKRVDAGEAYVIRQTIKPGKTSFDDVVYGKITVDNDTLDEGVLLKSDGLPTYNFANVVDDHLMEITHVVRGNEYLSSTPKYNLLYEAFGWEKPIYIHVPPVMKDAHAKLSKRNGDASFQDLIKKGYLPEAIVNYLVFLGWHPGTEQEIFSMEELKKVFTAERISPSPAIFDINKLKWMNGVYIRNMDLDTFHNYALPYYDEDIKNKYDIKEISKLIQTRIDLAEDIPAMIDFFKELPDYNIDIYNHKKMKTDPELALKVVEKVRELLGSPDFIWDTQNIHDSLMNLAQTMELKNGQVMFPARIALSGKEFTPGGSVEIASILGKEESLRRLDEALIKLKKQP